jgi:hypothetical protein
VKTLGSTVTTTYYVGSFEREVSVNGTIEKTYVGDHTTYPIYGYQEERPLTILFPSNGLRYIVRLATLFRVLGSSGDTDGSLKAVNSASYDFSSHVQKRV